MGLLNIAISGIAQTRLFSKEKSMAYECGEEPVGDTRIKFNTRFYLIALIFLIFDVEIVFLFPWAVVYRKIGMLAFVEMLIFIVILLVGLAYVWAKGDLEWIVQFNQFEKMLKVVNQLTSIQEFIRKHERGCC